MFLLTLIVSLDVAEIGNSEIVSILCDMYEYVGDCLALQYGGSEMHRALKVKGDVKMTSAPVLLTSKKRTSVGKEMIVSSWNFVAPTRSLITGSRFLCLDTIRTPTRIKKNKT